MVTTQHPDAMALLEEQEQILLAFRTRCLALKAFEDELIARTGERPFAIANTVVWDAMFAERDNLVIHFASWIRAFTKKGGFFGQLCAHHFRELREQFSAALTETPKPGRDRRLTRLACRLPDAARRGALNPEDIDALRSASREELEHVVDDRDAFRAHPYERMRKGTAQMLKINEISLALEAAERLLNDLRLLIGRGQLVYSYQSLTNREETAKDLVDLVLFGSVLLLATHIGANALQVKSAFWWQRRDAFLTALQEELATHPDALFNDHDRVEIACNRVDEVLARNA